MIVMNPPFHLKKKFSKLPMDIWDGDFIAKAYTLLKPGGEILAIATSKAFDLSHNSLTRAKKTKTKVGAMDLSHFNMPPPECVNVEREYKAHRWKPGEGKGGTLTLTFNMYRITKPAQEI